MLIPTSPTVLYNITVITHTIVYYAIKCKILQMYVQHYKTVVCKNVSDHTPQIICKWVLLTNISAQKT